MAIEDIIPLDSLFGKDSANSKKKKKVDREAMASPIMRIPRMDVRVARDLIDIEIREIYQLQGRAPETLFEEILKKKPQTPKWILPYLRMAVYFSEHTKPEPAKMHPQVWQNT